MQEINLYRYLPKEKVTYFNKKSVTYSYLIFLGLLILIHAMISWKSHIVQKRFNRLNTEVALEQQKLSTLALLYPVTDLTKLNEEVQRLQTEYEIETRNLELLLPYANFSTYMQGLAKTIVDGVWLTQINFSRAETKISLQGFTLETISLKNFYDALSKEPIFSNLVFKIDEIKQTDFPANFNISAKDKINI